MAVKSSDQITIVDLTDAYSINLSMDAVSLNGGVSTLGTAQTVTINVSAFRGSEQLTPTVAKPTASDSTNVTASVGSASGHLVPVTISFAAATTASGKVSIPVTVEGVTITKEFAYSISFKGNPGANGQNGTSVTISKIEYATSTTETQPSSGWSTTAPSTVAEGSWLWTKVTYSDNKTAVTRSKQGKSGTNGTNGTSYYTHIKYSTTSDGSDMSSTPTAAMKYIGIYTGTSSSAPTSASSYTWSQYTGNDGADAITMAITSSAGTIFKNSQISTTLTAHVYLAGVEVAAARLVASDLGVVKWYKDGSSTATATGQTLSISAGDVSNKVTYIAKLEK